MPIDPPSERARAIDCDVELPAGFDAWFDRCVNRDAALRFETAGECSEALANLLLGTKRASKPPDSHLQRRRITESAPTVRSPTPFSASFDKSKAGASRSHVSGRRRAFRVVVGGLVAALLVSMGLLFSRDWSAEGKDPPLDPAKASSQAAAPEPPRSEPKPSERSALPVSNAVDAEARDTASASRGRPLVQQPYGGRSPSTAPLTSGRVPDYVYGER